MDFLDDIKFSGTNFLVGVACGVLGTLFVTTVF